MFRRIRTQLLIYPKFQLALILVNSLVMIIVTGFAWWQTHQSFEVLERMGFDAQLPHNHSYFRYLDLQSSLLYSKLSLALFVGFIVSTIITLVLSHRLSGPIVRVVQFFNRLAQQPELSKERLKFREKDFFQELPLAINSALDALDHQYSKASSGSSDQSQRKAQ